MNNISIKDIPQALYEGYVWYSDAQEPVVMLGDKTQGVTLRKDAFIIEGLLWDRKARKSYRIAYDKGIQKVYCYDVTDADLNGEGDVVAEDYIVHRIPGVRRLSFLRYWLPEKDEMCEGFDVLMPKRLVFIGFNQLV